NFSDRINLYPDTKTKVRFYSNTGRTNTTEILRINLVKPAPFIDVFQVDRTLNHVIHRAARRLNQTADIVKGLMGLLLNRPADKLARRKINRPLAADIQPAIDCDSIGISTDDEILVFLFRMKNLFLAHDN